MHKGEQLPITGQWSSPRLLSRGTYASQDLSRWVGKFGDLVQDFLFFDWHTTVLFWGFIFQASKCVLPPSKEGKMKHSTYGKMCTLIEHNALTIQRYLQHQDLPWQGLRGCGLSSLSKEGQWGSLLGGRPTDMAPWGAKDRRHEPAHHSQPATESFLMAAYSSFHAELIPAHA